MRSPWHPDHGKRLTQDDGSAWEVVCAIIIILSLALTGWLMATWQVAQ